MDRAEIVRILDRVYFDEFHERETITNLHLLVRDGDLVIDVGASLGQYAHFLNQRFRGLHVTCVEADPNRYPVLSERCAAWTREGRNTIDALHAAACERGGTVQFNTTNSNLSGSLVDVDFRERYKETLGTRSIARTHATADAAPPPVTQVAVRGLTLDDLCGDRPPRLVKIDVEGAELEVVRGATGLLDRGVSLFLIEIDRRADNDTMFDVFARYGYRHMRFFNHTLFHHHRGRAVPRWTVLARRAAYKLSRTIRSWRRPTAASSRVPSGSP